MVPQRLIIILKSGLRIMANKHLVDANIFITAHRQYYPFDLAPSFWDQIIEKASDKIVIIEKVDKEIVKGKDLLTDWYESHKSSFTLLTIPEKEILTSYSKIINSINVNKQYKQSAKDEFAMIADSWLCAYGLAYDYTIVTLEKFDPDARKRIMIPNVCIEFGIKYIDLFNFMRQVSIRL
jgi:hypothetical protein